MSQKMIEVDFNVIQTLLMGMRGSLRQSRMDMVKKYLDKMDEIIEVSLMDSIDKIGEESNGGNKIQDNLYRVS